MIFRLTLTICLAIIIGLLITNLTPITLGVAFILIFAPIIFLKPELFFVIFLLLRPTVDITFGMKVGGINLAAIVTIGLILIASILLLKKDNIQKILTNKFLKGFNIIFLAFMFYSLLSFLNTRSVAFSLVEYLRLISSFIAVNYAVVYFTEEEKLKKVIWLIIGSSFIPLLLGAYQFVTKTGLYELGLNRINGTFIHPNVFAEYLVIIFFSALYLLVTSVKEKEAKLKIVLYIILAVTGVEFLLTYTRGAWIAFTIAFAIYVFFKTSLIQKLKYVVVAILLMLALLPFAQKRFADINDTKYYQLSSWQWRLQQWGETIAEFKNHPVIGHGMGMHEKYFKIMAHNDYLRVAFETGVPGITLYVLLIFYMALFSFKGMMTSKNIDAVNRYKFSFCFVVSMAVMSLSDNLARSTVIFLYFLIMITVLAGKKEVVENENITS